MGKIVLVACTNVGRAIIEEVYNNKEIKAEISGAVNLGPETSIGKANYDSYSDLLVKYGPKSTDETRNGKAPIKLHYCKNVNDNETIEFIRSCEPDIVIQSGWSQKFKEELLSLPKYCCIGEHPAPLPRGRGAACVNWAILTGETSWGDSFFHMVDQYDAGEVYAQNYFEILEEDNVYTVYEKVAAVAAKAVYENADKWCAGEFSSMELDETTATYYPKRRPEDGQIKSFEQSAKTLYDFIRAQTFPYPGTYIEKDGRKIILVSARIRHDLTTDKKPGTFYADSESKTGVLVACADGEVLEIWRVKEDEKPTSWAAQVLL